MKTISEIFKREAYELSQLYLKRKELSDFIGHREKRLRELGEVLEFTDNLEKSMDPTRQQ